MKRLFEPLQYRLLSLGSNMQRRDFITPARGCFRWDRDGFARGPEPEPRDPPIPSSILFTRCEIISYIFVHVWLICIPAPATILVVRDILEGIEIKAPEAVVTFAIVALIHFTVP